MSGRDEATRPTCADIAELLPVYLNGSLDEERAQQVRAHLPTCAACLREERETRAASALYGGHLPVEELVDYALALPLAAEHKAVIESHLATCEHCSEQMALVRRDHVPAEEERESTAWRNASEEAQPKEAKHILATGNGMRIWALAASLAFVVASAGWLWTWRALIDKDSLFSQKIRTNPVVVELMPATGPLLRQGEIDPNAAVNRVPRDDESEELVLVMLAGGQSCAPTCILEIRLDLQAPPLMRLEGLRPDPDGHLTMSLPHQALPTARSVIAVRDTETGDLVAEYLIEAQ